jgi:outer membrane protein OmpA-like peptidoglycan-associated protein
MNANNSEPIQAKISYNLLPENTSVGFTYSDSLTGEYEILLPAGSAYNYKVEADGYKNLTDKIDLLDETDFRQIERVISLEKGENVSVPAAISKPDKERVEDFISGVDSTLVLGSSVLFDFASSYLNEDAYPILDQIIAFMKRDRSVRLQISGHTDNVGPAQFNLRLSRRRADSVLEYFTKNGISKSRFETVGYGMQRPVTTNDTAEGRSINRRVEFSIND